MDNWKIDKPSWSLSFTRYIENLVYSHPDYYKLVHEWKYYLIDLEMQNGTKWEKFAEFMWFIKFAVFRSLAIKTRLSFIAKRFTKMHFDLLAVTKERRVECWE